MKTKLTIDIMACRRGRGGAGRGRNNTELISVTVHCHTGGLALCISFARRTGRSSRRISGEPCLGAGARARRTAACPCAWRRGCARTRWSAGWRRRGAAQGRARAAGGAPAACGRRGAGCGWACGAACRRGARRRAAAAAPCRAWSRASAARGCRRWPRACPLSAAAALSPPPILSTSPPAVM